MAVRTKELGNTGVKVPEIALGTWQYEGGSAPLLRGIELGARFIDTAERYKTEWIVGNTLEGVNDVFVATKVRHEDLDHDNVIRACKASLAALKLETIDLYMIHRPNPAIELKETMAAMDRLVDEGLIRHIGVSNFSIDQLKQAQDLTRHRIVSNQLRYSLADRTIEKGMLDYCAESGVTLLAYSPLARGLGALAARGGNALAEVAAKEGRSQAQVALNWLLSHPPVVVVVKASTIPHMEDVCGASGWDLSPESIERLNAAYA